MSYSLSRFLLCGAFLPISCDMKFVSWYVCKVLNDGRGKVKNEV